MKKRPWLLFALITTLFWGVWGALIEIPEKGGFPATLGYIVWSLTMIPCAIVGLAIIKWKLDVHPKAILYGMIVGVLGAGGQLILFNALKEGPAYLVFPIISLSPAVTVILSVIFLKETTTRRHWAGIITALIAITLMSLQKPDSKIVHHGYLWFFMALMVFLAWGIQAFFMKKANNIMRAESVFFYMMVSGLLLAPGAYFMTDMSQDDQLEFYRALSDCPDSGPECHWSPYAGLCHPVWKGDYCGSSYKCCCTNYYCNYLPAYLYGYSQSDYCHRYGHRHDCSVSDGRIIRDSSQNKSDCLLQDPEWLMPLAPARPFSVSAHLPYTAKINTCSKLSLSCQ